MSVLPAARRYRSVFLSDLHLGSPACRAEALLAFLDGLQCERLYLLGDVVDGWRLRRRWYWPAAHAAVLQRLLHLAGAGTEVVYVPGNHDAFARAWSGQEGAGVRIAREWTHQGADGRRYLLTHGDLYDPRAGASWLAEAAGDLGYRALLRLDRLGRWVEGRWARARAGLTGSRPSAPVAVGFSLAAWAKSLSPTAARVVAAYEERLAQEARGRGFDGVVCGHIHSPARRPIAGALYVNCGDWVESCTAAVEAFDGVISLLEPATPVAVAAWRRAARPRLATA